MENKTRATFMFRHAWSAKR